MPRTPPKHDPLSPADFAEALGVAPETILRLLQRAQTREELFPEAQPCCEGWRIPAAALRRLLGPKEQRLYPVADFAQLIGFSTGYVYELIKRGLIQTRLVFGQTRIPASQYYALPAHKPTPDPTKAPAPFFSREEAHSKQ